MDRALLAPRHRLASRVRPSDRPVAAATPLARSVPGVLPQEDPLLVSELRHDTTARLSSPSHSGPVRPPLAAVPHESSPAQSDVADHRSFLHWPTVELWHTL